MCSEGIELGASIEEEIAFVTIDDRGRVDREFRARCSPPKVDTIVA
jgi:hypothetical protein